MAKEIVNWSRPKYKKNLMEKPGNSFHVTNMENKIKNSKKPKLGRPNYKNIETFDVLHVPVIADNEPNTMTSQSITNGPNVNGPTKAVVEGFKFKESDYDGLDNVKDNTIDIGKQAFEDVIGNLNDYYAAIDKIQLDIAESTCTVLSTEIRDGKIVSSYDDTKPNGDPKYSLRSDTTVVKSYFSVLITIILSAYITYNWYFLMFLRNNIYKRVELIDISRERLLEASKLTMLQDPASVLYKFLHFLFQYSLFFPEKIQQWFVTELPDKIAYNINPSGCFILLFMVILYMVHYFALEIKNFFIDLFSANVKNPAIVLMGVIVFYNFIADLMREQTKEEKEEAEQDIKSSSMGAIGKFFQFLFTTFFKVFIVIFVSVPAGAIFTSVYFFLYSFFGIFIYYAKSELFGDFIHRLVVPNGPGGTTFKATPNLKWKQPDTSIGWQRTGYPFIDLFLYDIGYYIETNTSTRVFDQIGGNQIGGNQIGGNQIGGNQIVSDNIVDTGIFGMMNRIFAVIYPYTFSLATFGVSIEGVRSIMLRLTNNSVKASLSVVITFFSILYGLYVGPNMISAFHRYLLPKMVLRTKDDFDYITALAAENKELLDQLNAAKEADQKNLSSEHKDLIAELERKLTLSNPKLAYLEKYMKP